MSSEMPLPNPAGEIWPTSLAELFSFFPTLASPGLLTWSPVHIWVVLGQLQKGLRDFYAICHSDPGVFPALVWVQARNRADFSCDPLPSIQRGLSQSQTVGKVADTHKHVKTSEHCMTSSVMYFLIKQEP